LDPNHDIFEEIRVDVTLSPCHQLVIDGALEQLQPRLEQTPGMVSFRDHYGFTLLHWAALCSGPEMIRAVIDAGADVNARSKGGGTVLMWAVSSFQSARVCDILIQAGAELEVEDQAGMTVLHHALGAPSPDTATIEIFLRAGANANHIDNFGLSVLHYATVSASTRHMEMLLSYGADIDAKDSADRCLIDHAIRDRNHGVLAVLLKHIVSANHHWTDKNGTYSEVIFSTACYGDVATMRLLINAQLVDIVMDNNAVEHYWYWFDTRPPPAYGEPEPIEDLESAFQTLLDRITPRKIDQAPLGARPLRVRRNLVPGAFPADDSEQSDDGAEDEGNDPTDADHDSEGTGQDSNAEDSELHSSHDPLEKQSGSRQPKRHSFTQEIRTRRSSI